MIKHTKVAKPKVPHNKHAPCINTCASPDKIGGKNLMGVSPLKEQFEPTEASPMRQHHKMAVA